MLSRLLSLVTLRKSKTHAVTIGGWTPGLRLLAKSQLLACGCLIGVYHTLSNEAVAIVDAPAGGCPHRHDQDGVLWRSGSE
jgi:hypothetical protein